MVELQKYEVEFVAGLVTDSAFSALMFDLPSCDSDIPHFSLETCLNATHYYSRKLYYDLSILYTKVKDDSMDLGDFYAFDIKSKMEKAVKMAFDGKFPKAGEQMNYFYGLNTKEIVDKFMDFTYNSSDNYPSENWRKNFHKKNIKSKLTSEELKVIRFKD